MNREASQRLKRAIQLGSLSIVKRILASNPHNTVLLQNVDEEGNTSLHLAAQLGLVDIAVRAPYQGTQLTLPCPIHTFSPRHDIHIHQPNSLTPLPPHLRTTPTNTHSLTSSSSATKPPAYRATPPAPPLSISHANHPTAPPPISAASPSPV